MTALIGSSLVLLTTLYIGHNLANKCFLSGTIDVHQCQPPEYLAAYDNFVSMQNEQTIKIADVSIFDSSTMVVDQLEPTAEPKDKFVMHKGDYCIDEETCTAGARIYAFWTGAVSDLDVDFTDICAGSIDSKTVALMINHISVPKGGHVEITQKEDDKTHTLKIGGLYGNYKEGNTGDFT